MHCLPAANLVYCQTRTMAQRLQRAFSTAKAIKLLPNCVPGDALRAPGDIPIPGQLAPYSQKCCLICLTRYYAHKNLEFIVETFDAYRESLRDVVVFLTISAKQAPQARRLLRRVARLGLSDQIVNLGPLGQTEIPAFFRHCHALLFPTRLESFSTTYLEAMFCGLPILTSDLDFAHDVCGPAALYFDPWSPTSMKQAILQFAGDVALRARLADLGRQRLASNHGRSWEDIAGTLVSDLRELVFADVKRVAVEESCETGRSS
ncbi:MAG: glycosyltransferase [Sedimentisphaerales bacterium]|nr:glycosyltransferase [Sedimentisphaerales bacterium]